MEFQEYTRYDAVGLRGLIAAGEVTAAEVETVARQALELANSAVNGLALPVFSPALEHADDGPFTGVPFLIKDVPMARGVPFSLGSRSLRGVVARHDTDLMTRFRAAGLVTLGSTTMPEMGLSFSTESVKHGPTRNPWDLARGVGGSSGGAAALVAAGAVPVAHANDSAGSIRVPAACCGLVGLKPSRGRTPSGPDMGDAMFGLHYEFALTRTVRDAAHLLDAVAGPAVGDTYTAPPPSGHYANEMLVEPGGFPTRGMHPRLRVALTTQAWSGVAVDREVAGATVAVGRTLEGMGHRVVDASPTVDWDAVLRSMTAGEAAAAAPVLMAPRQPDPTELEAVSRQVLKEVRELSALELMARLDAHNRVTRSVGPFFVEHDLLVTPTLGQLPAPHNTLRYDDSSHTTTSWLEAIFAYGPFTALFNISGQPAINLPLGHSECGLPIGVQLIAAYGREDVLFRIAAQLEEAMPWRHRTPTSFVGKH